MNNAFALPAIQSGNGSLEQYIHTVNSIPMLSQEEETRLAERRIKGDLNAAKQLILSHLRVVVSIARGYDGYGLNQADLIQEGNIGLMKAVKRYEPGRGARLFSFAVHWIKAEIHEFILRNWRLVRVATTKPQRKLFFNLRSMRKNLNVLSPKEAQDIADDLGVKLSEVLEMEQRMTGHDIAIMADNSDDEDSFAPSTGLPTTIPNRADNYRNRRITPCKPKACKTPWRNWTTGAAALWKAAGFKTTAD